MREHFVTQENTNIVFSHIGPQAEKEQTKKHPAIKLNALVEATGFEPAAPWSQTRCATKLRHASLSNRLIISVFLGFVKIFLVISRQFDG